MADQEKTNTRGREALLTAQRKGSSGGKSGAGGGKAGGRSAGKPARINWGHAVPGFILGVLVWMGAFQVGLGAVPFFRPFHGNLAAGLLGALLGMTRARVLLWTAGAVVGGVYLTVGYTGVIRPGIKTLLRSDKLQRVEAVVVLSSDNRKDGQLEPVAQLRILHGYEIVRQGLAARLVLTRLPRDKKKSYLPAVQAQAERLGIALPVEETEEEVRDTHDEALAVSRLARKRGWQRVILVSDPTHMRRARAVFRKAGLEVLCSPSMQPEFDPYTLSNPGDRIKAFNAWLYEVVGYEVYRLRGWI